MIGGRGKGGGGLHVKMAGRMVEWFWVAKCNHNCWNSVAESFVKASYLTRTRHAHQVTTAALHILQQKSAFLSYVEFEPDHAVSSEQWHTQMEIEQPQLKHWALVLDFQLCLLRLVRWVRCSDYHPWNVRLNVCPVVLLWTVWTMRCQTFSSLSFFCRGAFVVWKTKQRKRRGDLCGLPTPSSGILLWTDSLYLQTRHVAGCGNAPPPPPPPPRGIMFPSFVCVNCAANPLK